MKRLVGFMAIALFATAFMTSCKSSESAYKKAYEKAKLQQANGTANNAQTNNTVVVEPVVPVTPNTPTVAVTDASNDTDVRRISGGITVVNGSGLKDYSVVVGSFTAQANAEGLQSTLKSKGYDAQVIKTNETINGITGWYRVIATTFASKDAAIESRNALRSTYSGAWLLYNK